MNRINDGGPAFPVWELNGNGQPEMTGFGMTLRDYFAAKALPAVSRKKTFTGTYGNGKTRLGFHTKSPTPCSANGRRAMTDRYERIRAALAKEGGR